MDGVLLCCGRWEQVDHDYPGGIIKSHCAVCGVTTGTSTVNYARASLDGVVKICCPTCFPIEIANRINQGESVTPHRVIRQGVVDRVNEGIGES